MGARDTFMGTLQAWLSEGLAAENGHVPGVIMAAFNGRTAPSDSDKISDDYWCAITMGGAAFYAGARGDNIVPVSKACRTLANKSYASGTWHSLSDVLAGNYTPEYGDIYIQLIGNQPAGKDDNGNPLFTGAGHTGAVLSYNPNTYMLTTISGNESNRMNRNEYNIATYKNPTSGKHFVGFIRPRWELADVPSAEYIPGPKKTTTTIKADPVSRKNNAMFGDLAVTCSGAQLAMSGYIVDSLKTDYVYTADLYLADSKGNDLQYIGYKLCNEFLDGLQAYGGGKHKFEMIWDYNALSKYGNGNYSIKMYGRNPNNGTKKLIITKRINITCKSGQAVQPSTSDEGEYYPIYLGNSISIWDALESLGVDGTYAHRKLIAAANAIEGYTGTASQNTYMLSLLKEGRLRKE